MTMRLFDSHAQAIREFQPIQPNRVGIYLCGPTVQGAPHVGHLRSALVYDILRIWFEVNGTKVTLVRNVTDIDDKVLENAKASGEDWFALAYRFELEFNEAYRALNIAAPTYEPRATASIPEMLELIDRLIESGYAYVAEDASGDVYFASAKWPSYGELTNQKLDDMANDDGAEGRGKRDPRDFALWKGRKAGEPETASWNTKFGAGRPGWHIECSAMSTKYLGANFDIHGGGLDLRFPHHENELAQSRAAGDQFANYWLHNGLVNVNGQKMSKSLGNSIYAADLLKAGSPLAVRYYLGSAQYRSVLDYHEGVLDEAQTAIDRIAAYLDRATRRLAGTKHELGDVEARASLPAKFVEAMNDDLNVPAALAVLHETVRLGNSAIDSDDLAAAASALASVSAILHVLNLDPRAEQWDTSGDSAAIAALGQVIEMLLEERRAARANKDFAKADAIRDRLTAAGITIEDAAETTHWSLDG